MVVDTSVILEIFFAQKQSIWCAEKLNLYRHQLLMSMVNLAEVLILIMDKKPAIASQLEEKLFTSSITFIETNISQTKLAAQAGLIFPLNLGDCFAYALAKDKGVPLISLEDDFKRTDIELICP